MSMAASDYLASDHGRQAVVAPIVHKRRGLPVRVISRPYRLSGIPLRRTAEVSRLRISARHVWGNVMKLPRRTFPHLAAGAAALPVMSHTAKAQAYPTRPITIVV